MRDMDVSLLDEISEILPDSEPETTSEPEITPDVETRSIKRRKSK